MWSKADFYSAVAKETLEGLTASWQEWVKFLTTASRLYKYPFMDQMMIYTQRPDATACAEYDLWNDKMNRYVRRGSKGIALLDERGDKLRLRYVFDVADTGTRENSRTPWLWTMEDQHIVPIMAMLERNYGVGGADLGEQIAAAARTLADEYWADNQKDFFYIVDDSFLEGYDNYNIGIQFKTAATASITYTVLSRCGLNPTEYMGHEDFMPIFDFNTIPAVMALGSAVSQCSRQILLQIGDTIRTAEREAIEERRKWDEEHLNLHEERGLPDSEPETGRAAGEAPGQIWTDAPGVSEGEPSASVQSVPAERDAVSAPVGDRGDGKPEVGADDEPASGERPGSGQEAERDGVGTAHERTESPGRGSDFDGAYQQLSFTFPEEATTIQSMKGSSEPSPGPFSVPENQDNEKDAENTASEETAEQREVPDLSQYPITRRGDDITIGTGNPTHVVDITLSEEDYESIKQAIPEESAYDPASLPYRMGDTVYLDNQEYRITELREDTVQLLPNGVAYPVFRAESRERFERLLRQDSRNGAVTEYLAPNPSNVDQDLLEVLATGLLSAQDKEYISGWLRDGEGNTRIAQRLSELFANRAETMELATGDTADFRTYTTGIEVEILDSEERRLAALGEMAPILRGLYIHEQEGFYQNPEGYRQKQTVLEGQPSYQVGDSVFLPAPDQPISGTLGYIGDTTVRIDTGPYSWSNKVMGRSQFEELLRQDERNASLFMQGEKESSTPELAELTTEPETIYPAEQNELPYDIVVERLRANEAERPEPETVPANFRITDEHLGEGGPKQKFRANIMAIQLLKKCEEENRPATPDEQKILSGYVGWGGLADAFDERKGNWATEYLELKTVLTPEEYTTARASTLNAHYTSPTVIHAIYDAVEQMGFRQGNILEPSMGVGNFFGLLPESMQQSRLYGVELDSISGRIAKKLYPNAEITVAGFETTDRRDFYDLAVGNVPFGDYKVNDKPYNKLGFSIHNYFFAKALDQVRPGGVVAFVTSRYTMDAKSPEVRKYLAQRAELLGAIRLPNNAFRANAGTDVVSDILFLQKREHPIDLDADWIHLGRNEDGLTLNSYFVEHPEMVLGRLSTESTQYGKEECTVLPIDGADLSEQLKDAISHIHGEYVAQERENPELEDNASVLPADPTVKNFSYTVVDGEVYFRENSIMSPVDLNDTAKGRVKGMVELRQIVNDLIQQQLEDYPDADIKATQERLNAAYDAFTAKYGLLNDRKNGRLFEQDSSYYLLCSLENLDEQGQLKSKAAMFTKRTIRPERTVTSVDTPSEALAVSIGEHGKVDLPYMAELLGTPGEYGRITTELSGVIFKDPAADPTDPEVGWQMADEYLSGDVRAKLRMAQFAAETNPEFAVNVDALIKAQPRELEASEIDVRLGATWLAPEIIQKFMTETFQIPYYLRHAVKVRYSPYTAEWRVEGKTATGRGDIISSETYGTSRANAYKILEETLNLKDVRIYDTIEDADGKLKRVLNKRETMLAQQKQQIIKDAFANWVWQDPQRRIALVKQYNELFNSTRPREYDGSHIHFVGMNPEITLREHQRNAIAHVLYGGNTLLAHEVGAGKTYEMAASAMEAKRLGLCQKSLFVVPNHLTEQWASEFLNLYPNAKLLVARRKDFETANRKKFCARIATGDYDAVIIGHSQFERIPLSFERQERIIQEQIYETLAAINELKVHAGENFSIKQMEKTRKTLETKLEKLRSDERKDDVITFEQLGVDRLFVDESHFYKNLFLTTKMRNVAGLSTSEAQKSSDMFGKCRYLDEITGGRGVVFATGTPVSNSMTELYTVMRYLQYSTLQQKKLTHFDCWASTFGETTTAIELAPEGTGYRARTRFAKFFNLPELMSMFKEVADIKTSDQLHLPVPEAKFETVVAKPSDIQKEMVQELSKRAAEIHSGTVDASVDNMLCVTNDGRKIGLDVRLMNPMLPDDPNSKLNVCVQNVLKIWEEGKDQKLTQLLFCDLSTPKNDGNFNVYDDIRKKLVAAGVPENEIEFIHNADTEAKKAALFSKVRSGDVRVLLGSTAKMGAGTNVQSRLVAVHHLDVGWKPSDMTQRNGRIIRQGNMNKEVKVFNYVTEGTFDSYLFQTLENKQRFISQIMTSKSPVRSCEDVDEQALSYAEIKALCAGNPLIKEKMDLDVQVAKLKVLKADHQSQKFRLQDKLLTKFPADIQETNAYIAGLKGDAQLADAYPQGKEEFCGMTIKGVAYDEKKTAGERLVLACSELPNAEEKVIGSYRGFELSLRFDTFRSEYQAILKGQRRYPVPLGTDPLGNIIRLDNSLNNFPERITAAENELDTLHQQQAAAQIEVEKPFPQEEELAEKSARLAELNAQLDVDEKSHEPEQDEEEQEDAPRRPSVLAALEEKSDKTEPVKPFRSYYDKDGDAR